MFPECGALNKIALNRVIINYIYAADENTNKI
jgi:hypothetical protein